MYNVGAAFVISVFTYYTLYRYIFKTTEFSHEMISIQVKWQTFYLSYTFIVIWISNMVKNEGMRTANIVHDIINCCDDTDLSISV